MNKVKFAEIQDPNIRLETIQQSALKMEEKNVPYVYTDQDKATMREMAADLRDTIDVKEDNKKALVAEITAEIKGLRAEEKELRKNVRTGYIDKQMKLYLFDDQETGMMEYYDGEGNLIQSRPLLPSERQTRMLSINTGTND